MPGKDDKSKGPAVAEPRQPAPDSSWAAGAPPIAASAAELAATATPPGKQPGLASGTPKNKTPGGGGGAAANASGIDPLMLAALSGMLDEKLAKQAAAFNQQLGALKERVDIAEAIADSRDTARSSGDERSGDDGDDGDDDDEYDDDDERLSVLDDSEYFLALDVKANKHFGVAALANSGETRPHRHDLYGHKPWMVLTKGGNDAGGSLAFSLSYAEPLSLYGKGLADKLDHMAEAFAAGDYDPHEFLEDLVAARNTARENYNLANRMRSIVVQKARAQRPGATVYDKAEVKYLERVLDERDYATADTADEIAQLRKGFAKRSNRAELDRLSKSAAGGGGYPGGGGGYGSDDVPSDDEGSSRGKSRSKARRDKAKERKRGERERSGERPGRGGGRDTGRGNGRGDGERARRERGSGAADAAREREREAQRSKAGRRDDGAGAKREGRRGQPGGGAGDGGGRRGERPPHAARGGGGASDDAGSDGEAGFE